MRYALLVSGEENAVVDAEDQAKMEAAFTLVQGELRAAGVLLSAEQFCPAATAATVQVWGGDVLVANGPFAQTTEQISSLLMVDCPDLDHAIEIAARIPAAWSGTIEIRPVRERPLGAPGPADEEARCATPC